MRTEPQIGNSHLEQMNLILEFVCHFDVNHLLYAINGKRMDEDQIVSITNDISEYHLKLKKQKEYLYRFGKTFNKEYAHEDNKYFDTTAKVSWKIRSGTAGVKKLFRRFCKVVKKRLPDGTPNPQAHERSMISTPNYMGNLFGLETYPPCVTELFQVMLLFYADLDECIHECLRIIKEEKDTRNDYIKCLYMLEEACEKCKQQQILIIEAIEKESKLQKAIMESEYINLEGSPMLNEYKHTSKEGMEQFASKHFHNCSPKDISKITLHKALTEADDDPNMMMAMAVLGKDKENIRHINYAIDHFDELLPDKCKRGVIPALYLYFFVERFCPYVGIESFLNYFNKRYKEHGGKWGTIGKSALSGARGKNTKGLTKNGDKTKAEMMNKLDEMLSKAFPKEKIA